jgi:hypothetical protein
LSPRVAKFQWDEANISHIARHLVVTGEVEDSFLDSCSFLVNSEWRDGELL